MKNPVVYVLLNKELKMTPGKAAAQAVHASMVIARSYKEFTDSYKRTVVVLEAENTNQLKNLHEYLAKAGLVSAYYLDEGVNEVGAYSLTALAVEPIDSEDAEKREIFEEFNLFRGEYDEDRSYDRFKNAIDALRSAYPYQDDRPWVIRMAIKKLSKR